MILKRTLKNSVLCIGNHAIRILLSFLSVGRCVRRDLGAEKPSYFNGHIFPTAVFLHPCVHAEINMVVYCGYLLIYSLFFFSINIVVNQQMCLRVLF